MKIRCWNREEEMQSHVIWRFPHGIIKTHWLLPNTSWDVSFKLINADHRLHRLSVHLKSPKKTFFFFHYKQGEKNENTHTALTHFFPSENSLTFSLPKQSNAHSTTEIINKRLSPMACSSAALRTISSASVKLANSTSPTKSSSILVPFKLNNPFLITQCPHLQAATSCNFTVPKRSFTCRSQANSSDDPRPS